NNLKPQDPLVWAQPHACHIKQKRRHGEKVMKRPCPCTLPVEKVACYVRLMTTKPHGERPRAVTIGESRRSGEGRKDASKKGVAVTEQPVEDQEEDGGGVDAQRAETIGNVIVSV